MNHPHQPQGLSEIPTSVPRLSSGVYRPVPGEHPPFMPVKCDRCGHTHNLHGDCIEKLQTGTDIQSRLDKVDWSKIPIEKCKFNSLHISHLPLKVDGQTEHLFVAILNGEAVGQVIAMKQEWGACGLRMLYVSQKHRFKGIGSRLVSRVAVFAHNEGCNSIEIAVHKGNQEGRKFWIRRKFIDEPDREAPEGYACMAKNNMKMIPLGIIVTDSATGLRGMLTHMQVYQDGRQFYSFQPTGLHSETRQPLPPIWLIKERFLKVKAEIDVDIPIQVLGTKVTDDASGFSGMATSLTMHISGCVHVYIQPSGHTQKGEIIESADFDLRRCSGKAIPTITVAKRIKDEKHRPSPSSVATHQPGTAARMVKPL